MIYELLLRVKRNAKAKGVKVERKSTVVLFFLDAVEIVDDVRGHYSEPISGYIEDTGGKYNLNKFLRVLGSIHKAYGSVVMRYDGLNQATALLAEGHSGLWVTLRMKDGVIGGT